jgi:predicted ATP-grasp superfamily ATP-dependent carboligase
VDTLGLYPDAPAARVALNFLSKYLGLKIDFAELDVAVKTTNEILKGFTPGQEVQKLESPSGP